MKVVITEEPTSPMTSVDIATLLLSDVLPMSELTGEWIKCSLSILKAEGYVRFLADEKIEVTAKGRSLIELIRSIPTPQCFWHCQTKDHRNE